MLFPFLLNEYIFYSLYEAHRRVQRVNQGLEDKLLKLVDTCETDKSTLTKDVAVLSHKLAEANYSIKRLTEDNVIYVILQMYYFYDTFYFRKDIRMMFL